MSLPVIPVLVALLSAAPAEAPPSVEGGPERWHASVETDPSAFLMRGWSAIVRVRPAPLPRWSFALTAFSAQLPSFMVGMNPENTGFQVRVPLSGGLIASRTFGSAERGGFFAGGFALLQPVVLSADDVPGEHAQLLRVLVGANAGYQWFPVSQLGLYLLPWVGGAVAVPVRGEPRVGERVYRDAPVSPSFAIHLGYEF